MARQRLHPESAGAFLTDLHAGAASAGRTLADLDLQVPVAVEFIRLYRRAGISTLALKLSGPLNARLATLAQMIELTNEVNRQPLAAGTF